MRSRPSGASICCISYCLYSSRENTMTRRARLCRSSTLTKLRPKDPLPPVMSTDLPSNWRSAAMRCWLSDCTRPLTPAPAGAGADARGSSATVERARVLDFIGCAMLAPLGL